MLSRFRFLSESACLPNRGSRCSSWCTSSRPPLFSATSSSTVLVPISIEASITLLLPEMKQNPLPFCLLAGNGYRIIRECLPDHLFITVQQPRQQHFSLADRKSTRLNSSH